MIAFSNIIEKRVQQKGYSLSVDELNQALELTTEDTPEEEKEILRGIVNFGTLSVRQVMKSRMEISAIDAEIDFHELMDKVNKSGYSRIPVYEETIDHILGVLYIKDLLPHIDKDENFEWKTLIRKSFFVPENKKADSLLKDFQKMRVHMAIVVDEYGGTSGLITLEDLIEEIIGEINDEFDDTDTLFFQELDVDTFIFEGKVSLNDFCKIILCGRLPVFGILVFFRFRHGMKANLKGFRVGINFTQAFYEGLVFEELLHHPIEFLLFGHTDRF